MPSARPAESKTGQPSACRLVIISEARKVRGRFTTARTGAVATATSRFRDRP
jgi:hypothetical protein